MKGAFLMINPYEPQVKPNTTSILISPMEHPMVMGDMRFAHYHNTYELYYIYEGCRSIFVRDAVYTLRTGNLIFINKNIIHRTLQVDGHVHKRIMIEFTQDVISTFTRAFGGDEILELIHEDYHIIRLNEEQQQRTEAHFTHMIAEDKNKRLGYQNSLYLKLMDFLIELQRYPASLAPSKGHTNLPSQVLRKDTPMYSKVMEIIKYINIHYMEPLKIESLANKHYISPNYLSKIFREVTGFTYTSYVNQVRIREGERLLLETGMNVTQIADYVGYQNITHFGRVFKDITGYSPLNYRKIYKEDKQ